MTSGMLVLLAGSMPYITGRAVVLMSGQVAAAIHFHLPDSIIGRLLLFFKSFCFRFWRKHVRAGFPGGGDDRIDRRCFAVGCRPRLLQRKCISELSNGATVSQDIPSRKTESLEEFTVCRAASDPERSIAPPSVWADTICPLWTARRVACGHLPSLQ